MSTKYTFENLELSNDALISTMKVRTEWSATFSRVAKEICRNKEVYQQIASQLGTVPWQLIGVVHNLESGMRFDRHLHNGDSLLRRTVRVPVGRPITGKPPFSFEESALDALKQKGWEKITDWSEARIVYELERYNGFGYRGKGILSPYVWSGTNHYNSGKYVKDGVYDKQAVSEQTGGFPLYLAVLEEEVPYTKKEIVNNSSKLTLLQRFRIATMTALGGFFTVDTLNIARDTMTQLKDFMAANAVILTVLSAGVVVTIFKIIEHMSIKDANDGRYIPSGMKEGE